MTPTELRGRAIHEAAHAVIARALGLAVGDVWLDCDTGRGGADVRSHNGTTESARKHIVAAFAGTLAQRRTDPESVARLDAVLDHSAASDFLEDLEPNETKRDALDHQLWQEAGRRLADVTVWQCIEALADALLRRGRLPAPGAELLIDGLVGGRSGPSA